MDEFVLLTLEFDENTVFLCKTDALAFKQRLIEAREKLERIAPDRHDILDRLLTIESEVDAILNNLE